MFITGISTRFAAVISVHHCHMPEIELLDDTRARGIWAMEDYVEWTDGAAPAEAPGSKGFRGYGHYEEEYRVEAGVWKICFLRLTRLRIDEVPVAQPAARMGRCSASLVWLPPVP